jgi:ferredoxin-nitrite reductase
MMSDFTPQQKRYLEGFAAGSGLAQRIGQSTFAATLGLDASKLPGPRSADGPAPAEQLCYDAQDAQLAAGKKLCPEEVAKRKRFPLDVWDDIRAHAQGNEPPKQNDILAFKYFGIFWVAPAQDSFMARLRFPAGIVQSYQLRGLADLADRYGGGYADMTTRANLQIRQIAPIDAPAFLEAIYDLGIINRGAGADNIRNITASPLAGIDPQELYDTRALARQLNHLILNRRDLFGLPRKFNIAFDGGGRISALEDTNDIGFSAAIVKAGFGTQPGVYFRLSLGGITGHKDFARDSGIALKPDECVPAAVAIVQAFIRHGDRTDRKKARLKYVLERMGFDRFIAECEKAFGALFRRVPLEACEPRRPAGKHAHVGVHPQLQPGKCYVGALAPVGRLTSDQLRRLADLLERYGSRHARLTVWQNLIIPDVANESIPAVLDELKGVGLGVEASSVRTGLVACTGNTGCKYANADTKKNAMELAGYLEANLPQLDVPVNIHFTGCPHSCAQHFIGDIGFLGTKVAVGEEMLEGYHLFVGGGYGVEQSIGREVVRNILSDDAPAVAERLLRGYLAQRQHMEESFSEFVRRTPVEALRQLCRPAAAGSN